MRSLLLLMLFGCLPDTEFVVTDAGQDAARDVARSDSGDAFDSGTMDAATEDVGVDSFAADAPEPWTVCELEWASLPADAEGDCAGRQVQEIGEAVGPFALDTAFLNDGTFTVAWNTTSGFDYGHIELRAFAAEDEIRRASILPLASIGQVLGRSVSAAASGDTLVVAYWLSEDLESSVEIVQWRPDNTVSASQVIAGSVGRGGTVDVATSSRGEIAVAYHDEATGRHRVRRRAPDGSLSDPFSLGEDEELAFFVPRSVSVGYDDNILHAIYRRAVVVDRAELAYRKRITDWTGRTQLDSDGLNVDGLELDLAVGAERLAAAHVRVTGAGGELRVARFPGNAALAEVDIVESFDTVRNEDGFILDVEEDARRHLHLLWLSHESPRRLVYLREDPGADAWVRETVETFETSNNEMGALSLDADGRPHIVYTRAGRAWYARMEAP